ncbi:MAG: LysR family transcriptional regulator [Gammaproteobacteria bacterium]|jgi:molybdate transport repressor ModE-like protein
MDWDDLKLFLAVARNGSVSGAARQLNVQHSTVSRRLRQFEQTLGARLVDRVKGGCQLTPAGEHVRETALRVEREVLNVDGVLQNQDADMIGPLRVSALSNMATTILMPMFAQFNERYPQVELHIMVSNLDASLAQREADVAIRLTNTPTDTLLGKRIVTVASTIYASSDYLQQHQHQGGELKWLGVECCGFHKTWTRQLCQNASHTVVSDDTLLTLSMIRAGLGVSILPCFMGDADPALERVCDPDPAHDLGLWILLHPDLRRTARVLAFRNYMVEAIKQRRDCFSGKLCE